VAERFADREAIVAADRRITYAEFYQHVTRYARALLTAGVKRGHTVALWLPNRPEWLFIQYACAMIGAVAVSLNTRYKAHELGYILDQSEATTLILTDRLGPVDYLDTLHAVVPGIFEAEPGDLEAENFPNLKRIIVDCEDPHPGCLGLRDLGEAADNDTWQGRVDDVAKAMGPDDPWMILYTSGTTSFPKGALISHRNAVPHGWYAGKVLGVTETDRVLHALPLTGTWGGLCIPLSTFTQTSPAASARRFARGASG
jgi:fatty-acyl-CoA synthase